MSDHLSPRQIVQELDRFIVGQHKAKRCVASALRNRWRRLQVPKPLQDDIFPKNILMIGPTGVGKTEIARRLARLVGAPFIKVEATKFTEVGYVGRDVEQIIRDLLEHAIVFVKETHKERVTQAAKEAVEQRLLEALVGKEVSPSTKEKFAKRLADKELEDHMIDIEIQDPLPSMPIVELSSQSPMLSLNDLFSKGRTKVKRLAVKEARQALLGEESDKLLNQDMVVQEAIALVEQKGIVFLDEIDKICVRGQRDAAEVSREGVQRDLLPLIEGTSVSTKHGPVKTDHILFIASGAFHLTKPSDLFPELQGRLPVRVELNPLSAEDFVCILKDTESSLLIQYQALFKTENVTLTFTDEAISAIAAWTVELNQKVENIGARRLNTILERLLEEISFRAPEEQGTCWTIDKADVDSLIGESLTTPDLSNFVL